MKTPTETVVTVDAFTEIATHRWKRAKRNLEHHIHYRAKGIPCAPCALYSQVMRECAFFISVVQGKQENEVYRDLEKGEI